MHDCGLPGSTIRAVQFAATCVFARDMLSFSMHERRRSGLVEMGELILGRDHAECRDAMLRSCVLERPDVR